MTKNSKSPYFKGNEDFIARIHDYMDQVYLYHKVFTPFLTPLQQRILTTHVGKKMYVTFDGGYVDSEYKRCMLHSEDSLLPFPITCLKASYQVKYHHLQHRDILGAMMNLGIKRNQFGDIVVSDGIIYLFVSSEIKDFIIQELTQVAHCHVCFEVSEDEVFLQHNKSYSMVNIASFRLDVVVSAITHLSRDKAKAFIKDGLVKVDYVPIEECSYICNNECVLSLRGYGRFEMCYTGRKTRSDRFCIEVGKYE